VQCNCKKIEESLQIIGQHRNGINIIIFLISTFQKSAYDVTTCSWPEETATAAAALCKAARTREIKLKQNIVVGVRLKENDILF